MTKANISIPGSRPEEQSGEKQLCVKNPKFTDPTLQDTVKTVQGSNRLIFRRGNNSFEIRCRDLLNPESSLLPGQCPFVPLRLKTLNLRDAEKEVFRLALLHCKGNRTKTAKMMGMTLRTVFNKIHAYQFEDVGREDKKKQKEESASK